MPGKKRRGGAKARARADVQPTTPADAITVDAAATKVESTATRIVEETSLEASLEENRRQMLRVLTEVMNDDRPAADSSDDNDEKRLAPRPADTAQSRKIFVGGLPWQADAQKVEEFFEEHGEIDSFTMPANKQTGAAMGIAFIVYARQEGADKALVLDGKTYGGQKIRVKRADPAAKAGEPGGKERYFDIKDEKGRGKGTFKGKENDIKGRGRGKGKSKGKDNDVKGKGRGYGKSKGTDQGRSRAHPVAAAAAPLDADSLLRKHEKRRRMRERRRNREADEARTTSQEHAPAGHSTPKEQKGKKRKSSSTHEVGPTSSKKSLRERCAAARQGIGRAPGGDGGGGAEEPLFC